MKEFTRHDFGDDFFWGVSTSALQIEGASHSHGKGANIWDEFSSQKNKILNNDSPAISCNFYDNYKQDIDLVVELNIPNFRISLSWSRIFPNGIGEVNFYGVKFYHDVIDYCLSKGVEPWVTLYHWDLPLDLEVKGGWKNRDITKWFNNYVDFCAKEFGTKVKYWMVLNEPMVFTGAGYFMGVHAPGKKGLANFLPALHHAVLCQAIGFNAIKKVCPDSKVGTTFSCSYITPYSSAKRDVDAAKRMDTLLNRTFIEPSLGLGYPMESLPLLKQIKKYILPGDEELMKVDFDFIGIQNYTREVVKYSFYIPYLFARIVPADKRKVYHTLMDWEVYPESIYEMIKKFSHYKNIKQIIVTENGASFPDEVKGNRVHDEDRLMFLKNYIAQVYRAKHEGFKVSGYFVWTLLDNFEWAEGYRQRFGLVYVNFNSQRRVIKDSGYWYKQFLGFKTHAARNNEARREKVETYHS